MWSGVLLTLLQVPGTKEPPKGTDLAKLNPCPLKVCCNIWGQCGVSEDFCTISQSETGAPGTSAPGKDGCELRTLDPARLTAASLAR